MKNKKVLDERFINFGIVGFTTTTKINDFIDNLKNGKVKGTYCTTCSKYFFPPRADCYLCLSNKLDWIEVGRSGKLLSYSELYFAPKGFEKDVPYSIALVDLGKWKIFGRIKKSVVLSELSIGTKMEIVIRHLDSERISYVFDKF